MPYDVFLSHNGNDKPAVRELAQALRERGLKPWLDEDELIPGRRWQKALEDIILSTKAVAVLIGPNGLGPWHEQEMEVCLQRCAREELPIIPVLLPGASAEPELPVFLDAFTWVDMRGGFSVVELARLEWGITGKKPADATGSPPTRRRYTNAMADELARAVKRREELEKLGVDTSEIREEILALKRKLRDGGQLKPGDILRHGQIERYVLIERIGQGGFATVWRSWDRATGDNVAIKVLHGQYAQDRTQRERFFQGAKEMARFRHESIVSVLEPHLEDNGYHYFVMALVDGPNLHDAVLSERPSQERCISLIRTIGLALIKIHEHKLVHRDIKPTNILLPAWDRPMLTDFDLVTGNDITTGTRSGAMGTLLYSAPELLSRPQDADQRADVYSLAMTALFALRGSELPISALRSVARNANNLACQDHIKLAIINATDWELQKRTPDIRTFCNMLIGDMSTLPPTAILSGASVSELEIHFSTSHDREHVGITLVYKSATVPVPVRSFHRLLLVLAEIRSADSKPVSTMDQGWYYYDEACKDAMISRNKLDAEIHRARNQFSSLGIVDPGRIIERRHSTHQIRIGFQRIVIHRL